MPIELSQFEQGISMKPDEVFVRKGTGKGKKNKGGSPQDTCPWCDKMVTGRDGHLSETCEHEFIKYVMGRPMEQQSLERITRNWNLDGSAKWKMNPDAKKKCEMCDSKAEMMVEEGFEKPKNLCTKHAYRHRFDMKHKENLTQVQRVKQVEEIRFAKQQKELLKVEEFVPRWMKLTKEQILVEVNRERRYRKIIVYSLIGRQQKEALKDWTKTMRMWILRAKTRGATTAELKEACRCQ